ncbi:MULTISPECIES: hypoxanthine phosphoribosyltransferase [unclassified Curtobacterium]|uniref:hypoxanthine phosphoribosyltransferase n=1 Tax=unclassified Curtobacterium TaxID=257496 RepID=UPI0008255B69|nr:MULTISPECIES: hypoxanthine phosphoribosyltransferase [unclassified Curtobacterium]WIA96928.1 hypoxanthine phosphoribosyltransferase [Curtobacterium sp. MCBA15_004]WIB00231.1 hypoxanthine phosphoribosyltransferase [Curtobacterium sp. MCBA15_012]
MELSDVQADLSEVLFTPEQIDEKLADLAAAVDRDYAGRDPLLVGVLKGAVMVMADFSRHLKMQARMDWMAVSSYGSGTKSSGVVRILKDLDTDLHGRDVIIVEDIIDSGLTLSWLKQNLESRGAASVEIVALLRKPEAAKVEVDVKYAGFEIPDAFVVGYGLDFDERYRNLRGIGVLAPHVYS